MLRGVRGTDVPGQVCKGRSVTPSATRATKGSHPRGW